MPSTSQNARATGSAVKADALDIVERADVVSTDSVSTKTSDFVEPPSKWRDQLAFWVLACCNNFGYTLLLTAAHDILNTGGNYMSAYPEIDETTTRDCNLMSTGSILLADSLPALFIKSTAPFLPASEHVRMSITITLYISGFLLVAFSSSIWVAILGAVVTSMSHGMGEVTCLSHSPFYNKNVLPMWSSGNAASGLLAAVSLAGLTFLGFTARTTLKIMIFVPVVMGLTFWFVLTKPTRSSGSNGSPNGSIRSSCAPRSTKVQTPRDKLRSLPSLLKYMLPVTSVYLFQYFINQGLSELIQFDGIWLDHAAQYRWIQVVYQCGKFISQSSRGLIRVNRLWILVLFQFCNVFLFSAEVVLYVAPVIWIVFGFALWEGLVGGLTYLNVLRRISVEVPSENQDFALVMASLSDSVGITLSGFISIPVHNILCQLPKPHRTESLFH